MAGENAQPIANRNKPIPIPVKDGPGTGTSTPTTSVAGDLFKDQVGQLQEKLAATGVPSSLSLQDRLFAGIMSQLLPKQEDITKLKSDGHGQSHLERPGFSLATMGVNFQRFNARVGVLFVFQDTMVELLSWQRPTATLSLLAVYTFICLNPHLLPVLPLFIALYFVMMPAFLARRPAPPNDPRIEQQIFGPATAPPTAIKPAPDMSRDFLRNMRDLQNSMADLSRLHDAATTQITPYVNFSDEALSSILFIAIFVLANLAFLAAHLIPWKTIALTAGWAGIGAANPHVQAFLSSPSDGSSSAPRIAHFVARLRAFIDNDITLDEAPEVRQVEIFELQKHQTASDSWESWLFSPTPFDPLSPARIAGARPKGTQFFEDVQPPAGWTWKHKRWTLDPHSAEWIQQRMITMVEVETEGDMWVYDIPPEEEEHYMSTVISSKGKAKARSGWEEAHGVEKRGDWRRRRWVREVERKPVQISE